MRNGLHDRVTGAQLRLLQHEVEAGFGGECFSNGGGTVSDHDRDVGDVAAGLPGGGDDVR